MTKKMQVSPTSKEKEVLHKANGQPLNKESENDPPIDIQQIADKISVAELIQLSMKNAEQIKTVKSVLDNLYQKKAELVKRRNELKQILKPVSRSLKKIHSSNSSLIVQPREKKVLRSELADIEHQLFLIGEEIALNESDLSRLTGKSSKHSKEIKLRSKANGRDYTKRNKHLIRAKMLKAINSFRQTSDAETISKIRKLAQSKSPNATKTFKLEFGKIVQGLDLHTFILCTGLLSDELYGAARLTILSKSASFKGDFEELIMPKSE